MNRLEEVSAMLEFSLSTRKKRHIAGGILLSISLLFGGLAVTVITIKSEEEENDERY